MKKSGLLKFPTLKAEGLVRPQAGVKPLQISILCKNPEGVTEWSATPSGLLCLSPLPGVTPPAVFLLPLRGLALAVTVGGKLQ